MRRFMLVGLFLSLAWTKPAYAGDLKIVDDLGLVRAFKRVAAPVSVYVTTGSAQSAAKPSLINVDGLSSEIAATQSKPGTFVFSNVPEGTWRVQFGSAHPQITEVKIAQ